MSNVVYLKVGEHRGRRRIWLQGQKLARKGYVPGKRYRLFLDEHRKVVRLERKHDGERIVSRKGSAEIPVIDLKWDEMEKVFAGVERVRVVIRKDRITVSIHHVDAGQKERVCRFRAKLRSGQPLDIGSLAHGGGVLDLAIHNGLAGAGLSSRLAFAVEIEDQYLEASQENNPVWDAESIAICAPMEEVEVGKLPKVDGLVAGLPCTGASLSGRAKNGLKAAEEHETAGALFLAFLATFQAVQPAFILLENVPQYQNTVSMTVIRNVLEGLGYDLHERVIDGMGALENRQRFVMVALTKGLVDFDIESIVPVRAKEAALRDVLEEVPLDSPRWKSFDYLAAKEERDRANGKGFRRQLLTGDEDQCGTIGRGYAKCRSTEPFLVHPEDPALSRLLTPVEHARVKTIPERLVAGLSDTIAHQILGQSVIFTAFEAVGQHLGKSLRALGSTPVALAA